MKQIVSRMKSDQIVRTFIKKLKRGLVHSKNPIGEDALEELNPKNEYGKTALKIKENIRCILQIFFAIKLLTLLVCSSISVAFPEILILNGTKVIEMIALIFGVFEIFYHFTVARYDLN